jgi:hypothetical protein
MRWEGDGMTEKQWELLRIIYKNNLQGIRPLMEQCNKKILDACLRKSWVMIREEKVNISELGKQAANEYRLFADYDEPKAYRTKW